MINSLIYLALWALEAWVAGAATVGDPGPYGLGAAVRELAMQQTPGAAWWQLPAATLVGVLLATYYTGRIVLVELRRRDRPADLGPADIVPERRR